ncbi:MAG: ABC transporter permease subunit [Actinobacteria bacterium]|nr:ABC transporter permease subunit [Actinomycetota bacterium]
MFLLPALFLLGVWVVYPIFFSVVRSLYGAGADAAFIGVDNYKEMFTDDVTLTALKNNIIWVLVAPSIVTAFGLVFAVLAERVSFERAFKIIIFMPMAISFLAVGVIFRLVYQDNPDVGLANAVVTSVRGLWESTGQYAGAAPSQGGVELQSTSEGALATTETVPAGSTVELGLARLRPDRVPDDAVEAAAPPGAGNDVITGTVWLDFTRGGGGEAGVIDPTELALPGTTVEAVSEGRVVATADTDEAGNFTLSGLDPGADYTVRLAASNFRAGAAGYTWLGPTLVTPAIIAAFVWMWAGFAMVLISAGLAAIPRETLESARVDGANEWQVFRRIMVPQLWPVLTVVLVTLMINVLKIFDLVLVIAPGSVQDEATVLALQMWREAFQVGDRGFGSAMAIFLLLLVIPAMLFNLRRFRLEEG